MKLVEGGGEVFIFMFDLTLAIGLFVFTFTEKLQAMPRPELTKFANILEELCKVKHR